MSTEKLVPKLRFNGFDEEWNKCKLKEICNIQDGTHSTPNYVDEGVPFYSVETITSDAPPKYISNEEHQKLIKRCKPKFGDILLTRIGTLAKSKIVDWYDEFSIYVSLALLSGIKINNEFLNQYIQTEVYQKEFLKRSLLLAVPQKINLKDLNETIIKYPSKNEEEKIANFLNVVDKKIDLLTSKYENYVSFKKYLMQQIFAQKLRFDFDDEWKKVKLKDIVERVTRKNTNLETDLALTISAEYGLIDQEEFFNKIVASKSLKNYYLIKKGEFAYNKSYSNGYPYGAIKRLDNYPMGALSTLYICFKPTNISSDYLKEYFETTFWYKEIYSIAVEGARNHGLLNINVNDFFNTKHLIPPSTEEQEKIADLFKSINSKIDTVNNDLILVKNFKKGLLQQMFV